MLKPINFNIIWNWGVRKTFCLKWLFALYFYNLLSFSAFAKLWKATISFVMFLCRLSVCPYGWNNSAPTRRVFMEFGICVFFENLLRKFKLHQDLKRIKSILHEGQYTFLIISPLFLTRMKNFSDEILEKIKTHIFCSIIVFRISCRLWDNVEKYIL